MYPDRELIRLAAHKAALRRSIGFHRIQCVQAAARLAQPLHWLDRALAFWRRLPTLARVAAIPLGLVVARSILPQHRLLGSLLRWGPLVLGAVRGIRLGAK